MKSEMHLLVIWEKGRYQQDRIIKDLELQFRILNCYEVKWDAECVANNFTRFYGVNLPKNSFKEKECGGGEFLLFILMDTDTKYEMRQTSHGNEVVNIKLFDLKEKYRSWTGGGHKIHATNSPEETNHDITLLLGVNYEDYLKEHENDVWDGKPIKMHRNISGEKGWQDLKELFYVLNNTVQYVVMRGEENLTQKKSLEHGDIDVLVREWQNAIYIMKGELRWDSPVRPKVLIVTKEQDEFLFDLWKSSLSYHSAEWQENMLATRVDTGLYYKLNEENDFFSLVYHCLVNKKETARDYYPIFAKMFNDLGLNKIYNSSEYLSPIDMYYVALNDYMREKGYEWTRANEDTHCFYNENISKIEPALLYLKEKTNIQNIIPYNVGSSYSGYVYFVGAYHGEKVFVKYGGIGESCKNEIFISKKLSEVNHRNFLKPLDIKCTEDHPFIVLEFVNGIRLIDYVNQSKDNLIAAGKQLELIYETLYSCKIMHRDIRPDNFMVVDGDIKLIDFQFAVPYDNKKEMDCLIKNPKILLVMGDEYRYNKYAWCDFYSFMKMAEDLRINLDLSSYSKNAKVLRMPLSYVTLLIFKKYARRVKKLILLIAKYIKLKAIKDYLNERKRKIFHTLARI